MGENVQGDYWILILDSDFIPSDFIPSNFIPSDFIPSNFRGNFCSNLENIRNALRPLLCLTPPIIMFDCPPGQ